jgi:uncharacterized membrane protein (UPF0127 family)
VLWAAIALVLGLGWGVFAAVRFAGSGDQRATRSLTDRLDGARRADEPFARLTEARLGVGERCLRLVVADDPSERSAGLRGRETLGRYDGMLFVSEVDSHSGFTMAGVPVPLDIGWYDHRGRRVDTARMEPCPTGDQCPVYTSGRPWRFALETLGGELPAGGIGACP